jgi:hypothetical protein
MRRVVHARERRKADGVNKPKTDREDERRNFQTGGFLRIDDRGRRKCFGFHGELLAAPPAVVREQADPDGSP